MSRARFKKVINYNKFHRVDSTKGSFKAITFVRDSNFSWHRGYGVINKDKTHLYLSNWNSKNFYRYSLTKDVLGNLQTEDSGVHFRVLFETF